MILARKKKIHRAGIFFFYDKDGIADPYIDILLSDIKQHLEKLIVVSNGNITNESKRMFELYADTVIERDNEGFDVWAYKKGLEHIGWRRLEKFDELILFNFTIFGPIYSFSDTFSKMDEKDVDFWGITIHNGYATDPWGKTGLGYLPKHIQSHFIAVRNPMICSRAFQKYWNEMRAITSYEDSVSYHEATFTKRFEDQGFTWGVSVDTEDITIDDTPYPLMRMPLDLVKNRHCPIVKRKSFFLNMEDSLCETMGESGYEIFRFIQNETEYDEQLILQNIIRTCNQYDIKNSMQFNYVLPSNALLTSGNKKHPSAALFMYIYFADQIDYCCDYAASMPEWADVYFATDSEEKKKLIEDKFSAVKCNSLKVIVVNNRGRDVSALLIGFREFVDKYDYICFAHDKKGTNIEPRVAGRSFSYLCFEGILKSKDYVNNIITTFEQNPKLGLLTPPPPIHGNYYTIVGYEWGANFNGCRRLAKELGLSVDMDRNKPPVAPHGSEFWFRREALKPLFDHNFKYADFPDEELYKNPEFRKKENISHQIERIHPFVAQSEGYYTAWVMPESIAGMEITMLKFYLSELNRGLDDNKRTYSPPFGYKLNYLKGQKELLDWYENQLDIHRELVGKQIEYSDSQTAWIQKMGSDIDDITAWSRKLEADIVELKAALLASEQQVAELKVRQ